MMLYLIGSSWEEAVLRLALIVLDSIDLFGKKLSLVGLLWVVVVQLVCLLLSWKGACEWILLPKCWLVRGPKLDKILLVGAKHFDIFTQIGYPLDYHTSVTSVLRRNDLKFSCDWFRCNSMRCKKWRCHLRDHLNIFFRYSFLPYHSTSATFLTCVFVFLFWQSYFETFWNFVSWKSWNTSIHRIHVNVWNLWNEVLIDRCANRKVITLQWAIVAAGVSSCPAVFALPAAVWWEEEG